MQVMYVDGKRYVNRIFVEESVKFLVPKKALQVSMKASQIVHLFPHLKFEHGLPTVNHSEV